MWASGEKSAVCLTGPPLRPPPQADLLTAHTFSGDIPVEILSLPKRVEWRKSGDVKMSHLRSNWWGAYLASQWAFFSDSQLFEWCDCVKFRGVAPFVPVKHMSFSKAVCLKHHRRTETSKKKRGWRIMKKSLQPARELVCWWKVWHFAFQIKLPALCFCLYQTVSGKTELTSSFSQLISWTM